MSTDEPRKPDRHSLLHFVGEVHSNPVGILIDGGATHEMISRDVVKGTKIPVNTVDDKRSADVVYAYADGRRETTIIIIALHDDAGGTETDTRFAE